MVEMDAPEIDEDAERALTRLLQLVLVGIFLFGAVSGDVKVSLNAGGALAVSLLPILIRREFGVGIDVGVTLWITAAVVLHAVGILGPYTQIWWWDYLTHALSAFVLTGIAFAVVSAFDAHDESLELPEPYRSFLLVVFATAMAVLWEIFEFGVTLASDSLGGESVLVVFGPGDIVTDIVFTTLGGIAVVLWGTDGFRDLAAHLAIRLPR